MKVTNKQIYEELQVIQKKLPDNDNYISTVEKTIKKLSYDQFIIKNEIKEITIACENKEFGCGNNK